MEAETQSQSNSNTWASPGKFKLEWCQGFKDSLQIENRLKILELEKQRKIKDIEKKLEKHKKHIEIKINKHTRRLDVSKMYEQETKNKTFYQSRFQADRKHRSANINQLREQIIKANCQAFKTMKKQQQQHLRAISQQKNLQLEEKVHKRNQVRLKQIQAKQNIVASWNSRLKQMKQNRHKLIGKKIQEHKVNLKQISKMERKQRKILNEIFSSQKMEQQLEQLISDEKKMSGRELQILYKSS